MRTSEGKGKGKGKGEDKDKDEPRHETGRSAKRSWHSGLAKRHTVE